MKEKNVETLILGATFYGLSKLLSNPHDSILIERSSLLGSEFVDSLNEKGGKKIEIKSKFTVDFKKNLVNNKLINRLGEIYASPALYLFCAYIERAALPVFLRTEITDIQKSQKGYVVTLFNCDGFSTVNAKKIIDTTSEGIIHNFMRESNAVKSLNLVVKNAPDWMRTVKNNVSGIEIFRFPVEIEDDYPNARKKVYDYWLTNRNILNRCLIIFTANTFAYSVPRTEKRIDNNYIWIPSCCFDNLLQAIDEGQVQEIWN